MVHESARRIRDERAALGAMLEFTEALSAGDHLFTRIVMRSPVPIGLSD